MTLENVTIGLVCFLMVAAIGMGWINLGRAFRLPLEARGVDRAIMAAAVLGATVVMLFLTALGFLGLSLAWSAMQ